MKVIKFFFQDVPESGEKTFKRFYLPLTVSFMAGALTIFLIYFEKFSTERLYSIENMALALGLGVPLIGTVFLAAERFGLEQRKKCISGLLALALVIIYYFTLPQKFHSMDIMRYILLSISSVFIFFSFPIFFRADRYTFRKMSFFMMNRAVFSIVASYLVFGGLSFAIGAIQILFVPDWKDSYRLIISIFSASSLIIAPWIFFAGMPEVEKLTSVEPPEKANSILSKFIFIPVVLFYLVILYLYFGKVLFFEELPKGMTSYLILSFCSAGIVTYFFIMEESKNAGKGISSFFEKWFFRSVLPLTLLLWYAIWKRTDDYGITEKRYILIVLAVLLTVWTVYFIFSKGKNVVSVSVSMALVPLFISFGPWGIFETSYRSQESRLIEILEKNSLIENGVIIKAKGDLPFQDRKNLSSILIYIEDRWGLSRLGELVPAEAVAGKGDTNSRGYLRYSYHNSASSALMTWMGLKFVSEWENEKTAQNFNFYLNSRNGYTIKGPFDAMIFKSCPEYGSTGKEQPQNTAGILAEFSKDCRTLTVSDNGIKKYEKDLFAVISDLKKRSAGTNDYDMTADKLTFTDKSGETAVQIVFMQAYGNLNSEGNTESINSLSLYIYISGSAKVQ